MSQATEPGIGNFQLRIRDDDVLVRAHQVHGTGTLPGVSLLDVICRAARLSGLNTARAQLCDIRFADPVTVPEAGERRLLVRSTSQAGGVRVTVTATPPGSRADDPNGGTRVQSAAGEPAAGQPVAECLVQVLGQEFPQDAPGSEASASDAVLDMEECRRALGSDAAVPLDELYRAAAELGTSYGDFLRAEGTIVRTGGRILAEVRLGDAARARSRDFLVHPVLLDTAVLVALLGPAGGPQPGTAEPVCIARFWLAGAAGDVVYVSAPAAVTSLGAAGIETRLRMFTPDGKLVAQLDGLRAGPVSSRDPAVAARKVSRGARRLAPQPLDIAVVGMSGRYPGAQDLDAYWRNLETGHDAITEVPAERWRPEDYPTGQVALCRFGGFLDDVDKFDPLFFRLPPSTAAVLDPQERLFLQTAYGAVENAGYRPQDFSPPKNRIGVFVGATWADYRLLGVESTRRGQPLAISSALSSMANRVSFFFDFTGPSFAVDTACSSSLTALHLACRSIITGECDGAIAGGVNLLLHPDKYLLLSAMNMTSSSGRCRSFGAGGDGYVPGEGVGALFLKPLEQALEDKDTIHGVILGSAVNHGGQAAGYTVPHPRAQADTIRRALEESGIDPGSIGYLEAHGTGTALGDPIELSGLHSALAPHLTGRCALGSVKSNIGHLEAAAGIAAITKTLLQLSHGRIVPSLHSRQLNPEIDLSASPFYVPQALQEWPRLEDQHGAVPRRAGVSSFGAGGSNVHVVLEEFISPPLTRGGSGEPEILLLSARSTERLREYAQRIAQHLRADQRQDFVTTARTLQVGRPALEARLALVARDAAEAADALDTYLAGQEGPVVTGTALAPGNAAEAAHRYLAGDLAGAASAWARGSTPDWAAINGGPNRRVPLPGYPFERTRFWIELPAMPQPGGRRDGATFGEVPGGGPRPDDDWYAKALGEFESGVTGVTDELERANEPLDRYAALAVYSRFVTLGLSGGLTAREFKRRIGAVRQFDRYLDACLDVLARHELIRFEGAVILPRPDVAEPGPTRSELLARFPETAPFVHLLEACLEAYPQVLRGERPATDVFFPGSSLDLAGAMYRGNPLYDFYSGLMARLAGCAVRAAARCRQGPVRLLEIGAGTGGTSHAVLDVLAGTGQDLEYYYTDIGGVFVAHGRSTFGSAYPFTRFQLFDADRDPAEQGLADGSFDVVLAAGALHAAADIDRSLSRIRRLLVPSGMLVLGEAVENHDVMTLTTGLLDGWHGYTDPERRIPHAPLLSLDGWRAAMNRSGFGGFTAYGPGLTRDPRPSHRVIVASARAASSATEAHGSHSGVGRDGRAEGGSPPAAPAAALREADARNGASESLPSDALEPVIAGLVAQGLGVRPGDVRLDAPFSDYGVDSILAVKIVERINDRFRLALKPTVMFDHPSVRALSAFAASQGARTDPHPVVSSAAGSPVARMPRQPTHASTPVAVPAAMPAAATVAAGTSTVASATWQPQSGALDIAVIGMSGRFPGARHYEELWQVLAAGRDCVTEVPHDRWDIADHFHPWPPVAGKTYSKWGGFLQDVDRFDPLFFGIVPAEADFMDPQQRLFVQESWKAIEDAGIDPAHLKRMRCGVFTGSPPTDYVSLIRDRGLFGSPHMFTGNAPAILPARVAYHLDLTGPCFNVDTACSSSLVALHQACRSLAAGECDLALAGGVAVFATPDHHLLASSLEMLSPTGHSRAFDDGADGFVIAEGVAVVLLKPLAKALSDGDPVHGVIKGIAINQDGRTNGITAPSARSQAELEREVYRRFGVHPETIGYIETHGTGTKLGDPIEVEALTNAFRDFTDRSSAIPIGSVKTNIGHAAHASGMASLFKVLLAMRERQIPPSLHFSTPNRMIEFPATPFFVNTQLREWSDGPRRAAISSFGFSGTNCHMVVEEHVDARPATRPVSPQALVVLSARTADSLTRAALGLDRYLGERPEATLHDVAATLQLGRAVFEYRFAAVVQAVDELRGKLQLAATGRSGDGVQLGYVDPDGRRPATVPLKPGSDLGAAARAWVEGATFDFLPWYERGTIRRLHLPGYAFARERCWLPEANEPTTRIPPVPAVSNGSAVPAVPNGSAVPAVPNGSAVAAVSNGSAVAAVSNGSAVPAVSNGSTAERVRSAVLAAVAGELGIQAAELDTEVRSANLGLDEVSRTRVVGKINRDLALDLTAVAFPQHESLSEFAARVAGASAANVSHPATVGAQPCAGVIKDLGEDRARRAETYLTRVLADEARLPADRIRPRAPLQDYGIESVLIAALNRRLQNDFGPLPTTLFFEYQTLRELAGYFASEHHERLDTLTNARQTTGAALPAPVGGTATGGGEPVAARCQDIAVIGMSGRYPMAANNQEFWENLLAARDCITEIPADRWDHAAIFSEDPDEPGTTYAKWGGFIADVDKFDARFFNVAPKDAETMDPQQRLFLETAWAALEDAGYTPDRVRESAARRGIKDAGVFTGVTYGEYQLLVGIPLSGYWAVANRVSYHMGFSGPSFAVDTACSASLTAVHLACESLRRRECAYALAGGVNVSIHPGKYLLLGYGRWASSDGRCRTFGAGGDGYVPSEGVVTVVLKPLDHAVADGDRIYGVIRSSTINHDGRTNGFNVPNLRAQAGVVGEALELAGVEARSLSYVEAHGTGTSLGDPIEIAALTKAYRRSTGDVGYCAIGSAKASIGHLEAAAGAAGLVKTLLQLQHEKIVPSPCADTPNPNIDFAGSPFYLVPEVTKWPRHAGGPARLAAVSSFGAGGSNVHLIVAEAPATDDGEVLGIGPQLVLLSARHPDQLAEQARNLRDFLCSPQGLTTSLADLSWTLRVGRVAFEHRMAVVAESREELVRALDAFADSRPAAGVTTGIVTPHRDNGGESAADRRLVMELYQTNNMTRLAGLWAQGWIMDWEALAGTRRGRVVSLPTYPFARDRHWIVPEEYRRAGAAPSAAAAPFPAPSGAPPCAGAAVADGEPGPIAAPPAHQSKQDLREALERDVTAIFADLTKHPVAELDPDADFLDFGFDSVVSVRMLNRLMKLYGVRIPASAIEEYTTIRSFATHLVDEEIVSWKGAKPAAENSGMSALQRVLAAPAREASPVTTEKVAPTESVFLTGVTGVLGGKLLFDLLGGTSARVTCLVRAEDAAAATSRIRHFLGVYDPDGRLAGEFERRVTPVLGDVSRERMGLDEATVAAIAEETDLTIHAAGRTTLIGFYETLAPTNVDGTRRVIDFALRTPSRRLAYVSSFSALGDWLYGNNPPFAEHDIELGQGYDHLPYQETKYHAEKLVRAASDEGLLWNIFRPGNIMGDSATGRYPFAGVTVKGVYYDVFKTVIETGTSILSPIHWDVTPVDYVSGALLHLATNVPVHRETYHLTNPDIRSLFDVTDYLREFGYPIKFIGVDEYHRRAVQRLFRYRGTDEPYDSQTIEMIKYGVEIWGREHYLLSSYPDCSMTRKVLEAAGITCRPIAELIPAYLRHCIDVGYVAPPGPAAAGAARLGGRFH